MNLLPSLLLYFTMLFTTAQAFADILISEESMVISLPADALLCSDAVPYKGGFLYLIPHVLRLTKNTFLLMLFAPNKYINFLCYLKMILPLLTNSYW